MSVSLNTKDNRLAIKRLEYIENKRVKIDQIVEKLINILIDDLVHSPSIRGKLAHSYRFYPRADKNDKEEKTDPVRLACSFELYMEEFEKNQMDVSGGKLTIDNQTCFLEVNLACQVNNLITSSTCTLGAEKMCQLLNGNRFEWINHSPRDFITSNFWNDWKKDENLEMDYSYRIYPMFLSYLSHLIKPSCKILEVCGGDGALAKNILKKHSTNILSYYLIDLNQPSLDIAKKQLKKYKNAYIKQADIVKDDFLQITKKEQVDIVIGSGALTHGVLPNKEAALSALKQIHKVLKTGGFAIFIGHAPSYLTSDDFKEAGFEVKNMYDPTQSKRQAYIVQKQ